MFAAAKLYVVASFLKNNILNCILYAVIRSFINYFKNIFILHGNL